MSAFRRLAFVVLFLPAALYFFLRWIATGESALAAMDRLEDWAAQ